jgi:signal transduction histidine kinase
VLLDALTDLGDGNTKSVPLSSALEDRVATLKTTYPDAEVTAEVPEGLAVEADEMLGNVLGNVLGNAVEHNDADAPSVAVSATEGERRVVVRVADDGPGVPEAQKETIFRRGNRGLKESDIGSGFGLFFVDTMMEKYGGEVTVADNDPRGAVFELSFRKGGAAEAAEAVDGA